MFVARYSRWRLLALAAVGAGFIALGVWMGRQPPGAFDHSGKIVALGLLLGGNTDAAGHGIGWLCALMGMAVLPVIARQMLYREPALRVDDSGIHWHRWSDEPIAWSNVARVGERTMHRQRFVTLTLRDPAQNRATGVLGRMARANKALGFGDVALTAQGTDRRHAELADAVRAHAERYNHNRPPEARIVME